MKPLVIAFCFSLLASTSGLCEPLPLTPSAISNAKKTIAEIDNPTAKAFGGAMLAIRQTLGNIKRSDQENKSAILKQLQDSLEAINLDNTTTEFQATLKDNIKSLKAVREYNSQLDARMLEGAGRALTAGKTTAEKLGTGAVALSELIQERDKLLKHYMDSIDQLFETIKKVRGVSKEDVKRVQQILDL